MGGDVEMDGRSLKGEDLPCQLLLRDAHGFEISDTATWTGCLACSFPPSSILLIRLQMLPSRMLLLSFALLDHAAKLDRAPSSCSCSFPETKSQVHPSRIWKFPLHTTTKQIAARGRGPSWGYFPLSSARGSDYVESDVCSTSLFHAGTCCNCGGRQHKQSIKQSIGV